MTKNPLSLIAVGALLFAVSYMSFAQAQTGTSLTTFVSGDGRDRGDCTFERPCRTLTFALSQVAPTGQITIISNWASTESITIIAPVTITASGVNAELIAASGSPAVTVNAGTSDNVNLFGLEIVGTNGGTIGILVNTVGHLSLRRSTIGGFSNSPGLGISFTPTSGPHPQLTVQNSVIHYTSGGDVLIRPSTSGIQADAVFKHALVQKSGGFGIQSDGTAGGTVLTVISDSTLDYFTDGAIVAVSQAGNGPVNVMVEHTVIANSGSPAGSVRSDGAQARLFLNNSTITHNNMGVATVNGGTVLSYGNNAINANTINVSGTLTPVGTQ